MRHDSMHRGSGETVAGTQPPLRTSRRLRQGERKRPTIDVIREIILNVEWSPSLVAFLYYYFVVVTYYLPGADVAIVAAVVGLTFQLDRLRFGRVNVLFGLLILWAWIAHFASPYQAVTFEFTWGFTKLWLVVFVMYNVLQTKAQLRFFLAFAVVCFVLFPVRGATVSFLVGHSVQGRAVWNNTYSNPNDLAAYAVLFLSATAAFFVSARSRLLQLATVCAALSILVLIFFTQSRGALVALSVALLPLGWRIVRDPKSIVKVVAVLALAAYFAPSAAWDRLAGLGQLSFEGGMKGVDREGSAEQRYQILGVASHIIRDNALWGVGAGGYPYAHQDYASVLKSEYPFAGGRKDAHNTYFHAAAEMGIPGLILFLTMCGSVLLLARNAARSIGDLGARTIGLLGLGLIAFMVNAFFASLEQVNFLYFQMVTIEAYARLAASRTVRSNSRHRSARTVSHTVVNPT